MLEIITVYLLLAHPVCNKNQQNAHCLHLCFNFIIVSSTCFKHPSVHPQEDLYVQIWCDFDRASSLICGNKMPTRCNRGFYCRSYCLLNMFRASLCPSAGAQEYYTVVTACGISCCGFQVAGLVWSWGLCVRFAGCCSILQIGHITLSSTPDQQLENHSTKYHRQQPLYNTLELLMTGIVVPETCWASNKICNKNLCWI